MNQEEMNKNGRYDEKKKNPFRCVPCRSMRTRVSDDISVALASGKFFYCLLYTSDAADD